METNLGQIRVLFDSMPEAILILDMALNVVWKNKKASKIISSGNESGIIENIRHFEEYNAETDQNLSLPTSIGDRYAIIAPFQSLLVIVIFLDTPDEIGLPRKLKQKSSLHEEKDSILENYIFQNKDMQKTYEIALRAASVDADLLITGETGSGKTSLARKIHLSSPRKKGPFVSINCGAIPPTLLESELFGYERGSFSGADQAGKAGLLESANRGTVLLDEIGELPIELQVKFLHVIEEKRVSRIGGRKSIELDIRIIAATHKDLRHLVAEGGFRKDLYYRLDVISINIPPLRQFPDEIHHLIFFFMEKTNKKYNVHKTLAPDTMYHLVKYDWPGNFRELKNCIQRLVILSEENVIPPANLPPHILNFTGNSDMTKMPGIEMQYRKDSLEKELIVKSLQESKSIREAARKLGISHTTLLRKMNKQGLAGLEPN